MTEDAKNEHPGTLSEWPPEKAATIAYQVLDEAALRLLEIQLALTVVSNEVPLRFDEALPDLARVELRLDQAVQAASLLLQQADLSDDTRSVPMGPVAINRRHRAAVGRGAPQMLPIPSSVRRFNRLLGNSGVGVDADAALGTPLDLKRRERLDDNIGTKQRQFMLLQDLGRRVVKGWLDRRRDPDSLYTLIRNAEEPFEKFPNRDIDDADIGGAYAG